MESKLKYLSRPYVIRRSNSLPSPLFFVGYSTLYLEVQQGGPRHQLYIYIYKWGDYFPL